MKKSMWVMVVVLLMGALVLAACGGGGGATKTRATPPAEYAGITNPFEGDQAAVTAGQEIYTTNCAACHGDSGAGDGAAGAALDPKPANLQETARDAGADYIHWVIAEGGTAAGLSASMVAYKSILSEDQIWQVTTYVQSLK